MMNNIQDIKETEFMPLLEMARTDLYRRNAFRLLGLPVDSTARDFSKRLQMVEMAAGTGMALAAGSASILPLEEGKDAQVVREAIHQITNPDLRLLHEFFWFWPHSLGQSRSDKALVALAQGEIEKAEIIWKEQESGVTESYVSTHNLAVLKHLTALDQEWQARDRKLSLESIFQEWRHVLTAVFQA